VSNQLAAEPSAYLSSASHQPVHWHAWGDAAFEHAARDNKPVLLDIGAVWCHWCHVMDGESYEDPALAAYLNEHFVCVKVDRDERPDVDARYQRAVQALTGQGGWPLTAFLTADGDVFYGGTYFPPDGRYGRPGFRAVLERVREIYHAERAKVAATAQELRGHVTNGLRESAPGAIDPGLLDRGAERMARLFDWRYGGFGTAPKFPHPGACDFLLGRWWDTRAPWLQELVEKTLTGMARGGMYDQVGGGFHRYSVDERWLVPHFEKMSYDNAELLKAYLHGWAASGNPLFRATALGIVDWTLEVLADTARGGFGASQDADVGLHDDGDYFTWTVEEARAVLSADEWAVAQPYWDIQEHGEMHHNPAKNVLWVARTLEAIGADATLVESARRRLKAARDQRTQPFVDRSVYVSWNAMMADAFLEAGAILGRADCTQHALKTLARLWDVGLMPGNGMVHRLPAGGQRLAASDQPSGPWLLDDQVQAAAAFLTAFEHTGDGRWLDHARELMDIAIAFYWDDDGGGFFDAREQSRGLLATRAKPIQDAPTSSSNGTAALVLLRLAVATGEPAFHQRAERLLAAFAGTAGELGIHGATFLRALDFLLNGECKVAIADLSNSLQSIALTTWRPRRVVLPAARAPLAGQAAPVALVCAGTACAEPVRTPEALRTVLETFGRSG